MKGNRTANLHSTWTTVQLTANDNVSWGQVTLNWTTWCVVCFFLQVWYKTLQYMYTQHHSCKYTGVEQRVRLRCTHGSGFEQRRGKKRQRQYVLGLFRGIGGGGSLWSFCSPQCTRAKMFTYWRVPCYRDGGNGRAIGLAANRTTHLNTRGQRSSGTSIPSVKPDAEVY